MILQSRVLKYNEGGWLCRKKEDPGGAGLGFSVDFNDVGELSWMWLRRREYEVDVRRVIVLWRRRTRREESEKDVRRGIKVSDSESGQLSLFLRVVRVYRCRDEKK